MYPNFIIIGAQRCGTTSLYNYLIKHNKIFSASQKELHFFDLKFDKGEEWYQKQFGRKRFLGKIFSKNQQNEFVTGEASPYYIFHPLTPYRISKMLPKIKLIAILRNPIDRAYSHYYFEKKLGIEKLSFEEVIKEESKRLYGETEKIKNNKFYNSFNHQNYSYLARGKYYDQLKIWYKLFAKEQILIICSEDFYENPNLVTNNALKFLNLPKFDFNKKQVFNKGKYRSMNEKTRIELIEYFKPNNEKLYKFLNRNFQWDE